jgi:hypothetical protein
MIPYADATMWGPQPEKERKQLKPGDRLADGRVFMGNDPTAVLEAALERVMLELKPLEAQRDELLAKLAQVAPDKYGQVTASAKGENQTAPAAKSKSKAKRAASTASERDETKHLPDDQ